MKMLNIMLATTRYTLNATRGQVMLSTVLILSGVILGATAIAGLLMVYQVRQSTNISNSARAIYAADTGIEYQLYRFFKEPNYSVPSLENDATFASLCDVDSASGKAFVQSVGEAGGAARAFRAGLDETECPI